MPSIRRTIVAFGLMICSFSCVTTPSPAAHSPPPGTTRHANLELDEPTTTVSTTHVTRKILMIYRLDLMKDNSHSLAVAQVIRADEPQVRNCYARRLNETTDIHGRLALTFNLNKATGRMERVTRTGGSLKDERLVTCVTSRLTQLSFNVPHDMSGKLDYLFGSRDTPRSQ
jgi:hypothetical protein